METKEIIKILVLVFLFGLAGPGLGVFLKGRRLWQKAAFSLMCCMSIGGFTWTADWSLTLQSIETYRGHARGFHFYFNEVLALALVLARALERPPDFRWLPPGIWLYLVFIGVSFLTILGAPEPSYVAMAAFKAAKMILICMAVYHFIRDESDLRLFLYVMSATLIWEMMVVLYHKYGLGFYQIRGTFTHQNSLTMFSGLTGMVFLAAAMGPAFRGSNLCLTAFFACAVIVQSALSRGGLGAFFIGTVGTVALSLVQRISLRRLYILGAMGLIGLLGLTIAMDTIYERFTEPRNEISGKTRQLLKDSSWEMFKDHPLGVGWNNFAKVINHPYPYGKNFDQWTIERGYSLDREAPKAVVESLYWLLLAENGLQGLLLFLAVMTLFLWWNVRALLFYGYSFLGCLSLGILTGCGINYLQSYFERVLVFEGNMMLWLMMLGITARIESWRRIDARETVGP